MVSATMLINQQAYGAAQAILRGERDPQQIYKTETKDMPGDVQVVECSLKRRQSFAIFSKLLANKITPMTNQDFRGFSGLLVLYSIGKMNFARHAALVRPDGILAAIGIREELTALRNALGNARDI